MAYFSGGKLLSEVRERGQELPHSASRHLVSREREQEGGEGGGEEGEVGQGRVQQSPHPLRQPLWVGGGGA